MAQDGGKLMAQKKSNFAELITHVWRWLCGGNLAQVPPKKHSCISIRNHETDGGLENAKVFLSSQVCLLIFFEGGNVVRILQNVRGRRLRIIGMEGGRGEHQGSDQKQKNVMHTLHLIIIRRRIKGSLRWKSASIYGNVPRDAAVFNKRQAHFTNNSFISKSWLW